MIPQKIVEKYKDSQNWDLIKAHYTWQDDIWFGFKKVFKIVFKMDVIERLVLTISSIYGRIFYYPYPYKTKITQGQKI
jgi:hypothetical protein